MAMALPREDIGTVKATDYLEGHVNCRCTLVPRAKSYAEILGDDSIPDSRPPVTSGADAFAKLSPEIQRHILGPGKYELYRQGVPLEAFVNRQVSSAWGASRVAKPLRQLAAELEAGGWTPGGALPPLAPVIAPHVETRVPIKQPGEFETQADAEAWFKQRFPNQKLNFHEAADIRWVNATFKALDAQARQFPEAFGLLNEINFRNFEKHPVGIWRSSAYAHVASTYNDVMPLTEYDPVFGTYRRVMEFNTKWYGPAGQTTRPWTYNEQRILTDNLFKAKTGLEEFASSHGLDVRSLFNMKTSDFVLKVSRDMGLPYDDYYMAMRDHMMMVSAKEKLDAGGEITTRRDFGEALIKDAQTGFHVTLSSNRPEDYVGAVATHEFGHVLDAWLSGGANKTNGLVPIQSLSGDMYVNYVWDAVKNKLRANTVYGKRNEAERIAELFVEAYGGAPIQTPSAKRLRLIVDWFRSHPKYDSGFAAYGSEESKRARAEGVLMQAELNKLLGVKVYDVSVGEVEMAKETLA